MLGFSGFRWVLVVFARVSVVFAAKTTKTLVKTNRDKLVTVPTRSWPGTEDAGLDHLYTNQPEKLSNVITEFTGGSDHKLLRVTRYSKSLQQIARFIKKRVYKNFSPSEFL